MNWLKSDEDLRASELLCSGSKLQSDVAPPMVNLVTARHTDRYEYRKPEDFAATMALTGDYCVEPRYGAGALEFLKQFSDGRMGDFGTVRADTPYLTGTTPRSLQQWVQDNQLIAGERNVESIGC